MSQVQRFVRIRRGIFDHDLLTIGRQLTIIWIQPDLVECGEPHVILDHQIQESLYYVVSLDKVGIAHEVFAYHSRRFLWPLSGDLRQWKTNKRMRTFKLLICGLNLKVINGLAK